MGCAAAYHLGCVDLSEGDLGDSHCGKGVCWHCPCCPQPDDPQRSVKPSERALELRNWLNLKTRMLEIDFLYFINNRTRVHLMFTFQISYYILLCAS